MSHSPEPSGRALHEEVDRLDIVGQCDRWLVLLRHTHRSQRWLICTSRSGIYFFLQEGAENAGTAAEAVKPDPSSSWKGHSWVVGSCVGDEIAKSCRVVHPLRVPLLIRPVRRTYVVVVR